MTRRCSHCSHDGHNSRTCQNRVVKLFGVRINDGSSIRKSASMGNLSSRCSGSGSSSQIKHPVSPRETTLDHGGAAAADGYASEDFVAGTSISSTCRRRKKGVPWTQEEHRLFLLGLQKLGKGDWRGISRNYVISRTPIQVASHAQKYYMRHSCNSRRKRRSSLFDMAGDMPRESTGLLSMDHPKPDAPSQDQSTAPPPPPVEEECESREATNSSGGGSQAVVTSSLSNIIYPFYPVICPPPPAYFSPFFPFTLWPAYAPMATKAEDAVEVLKPTAVRSKSPINVGELIGMSNLSLGEGTGYNTVSSSLSSSAGSSRQSAFHANTATVGS